MRGVCWKESGGYEMTGPKEKTDTKEEMIRQRHEEMVTMAVEREETRD